MKNPVKSRGTERWYGRQLAKVARHVGDIVGAFPPGDLESLPAIERALAGYSDILGGWAAATGQRMLDQVNKQEEQAWVEHAREMGSWLKREIRTAPTGAAMQRLLGEQVALIKSLPLDAAKRVHDLTIEGKENSTRAADIAKEIMRSGEVSKSRAMLIARTEVARTASTLTQARAQHVGSKGYIWRTSEDGDVRKSHQEMAGVYVEWDKMPKLSDGTVCHAGGIYNCRCFPEPILPD